MSEENKKKYCEFTFKEGGKSERLKAYQSPRGLRFEDKRPSIIVVDCYQEFSIVEFLKYIQYLQTLAFAMEHPQQQ